MHERQYIGRALSCRESRNCTPRDIIAARDRGESVAVHVASADRLALLVRGQLWFAAELEAARLGPLPPFACAGTD
jgi:hypothetical protein